MTSTDWQPIACVITREGGGWQREERINDQGEREERDVPWGRPEPIAIIAASPGRVKWIRESLPKAETTTNALAYVSGVQIMENDYLTDEYGLALSATGKPLARIRWGATVGESVLERGSEPKEEES